MPLGLFGSQAEISIIIGYTVMARLLTIGEMLANRFKVIRLISDEGGMARVYEVQDTRDARGQSWALKQFRPKEKPTEHAEMLKLFDQEADRLKALSHRNIPQFCARFSEGGEAFLVLEYIAGRPLSTILRQRGGHIGESEVLRWSVQICDVLDYLHNRQPPIIYRDLKPDNLMITDDGVVKVIDFGIARTFKQGKKKDTMLMGTEGYAPPEAYGTEQSDARADIYALGATIYHLLSNQSPPYARLPGEVASVRTLNPAITQAVAEVVARAMKKDRDQRFRSAAEMKRVLTGILPGAGAAVDPPRPPIILAPQKPAPTVGSTRLCPRCSNSCRSGARFCPACGFSLLGVTPALLRLTQPYGFHWERPLPKDQPMLIGRTAGAGMSGLDLSFYDKDNTISRNHASIAVAGAGYILMDLGSKNGTRLNGRPVPSNTPTPLHNGDFIQLGGAVVLQFKLT